MASNARQAFCSSLSSHPPSGTSACYKIFACGEARRRSAPAGHGGPDYCAGTWNVGRIHARARV